MVERRRMLAPWCCSRFLPLSLISLSSLVSLCLCVYLCRPPSPPRRRGCQQHRAGAMQSTHSGLRLPYFSQRGLQHRSENRLLQVGSRGMHREQELMHMEAATSSSAVCSYQNWDLAFASSSTPACSLPGGRAGRRKTYRRQGN